MREPWDVLRSTARYFWEVLPPLVRDGVPTPWEVRLDDEMVHVPFCFISRVAPDTVTGNQHTSDHSMGMRAACFPGPYATMEKALEACAVTEKAVYAGLRTGVALGHPSRIPLYDYTGVGLDADVQPTDRHTSDYIRISGLSFNTLADPEDRRLQTLLVAFTAQWRSDARYTFHEGVTATEVRVERGTVS